ncbi:hypothetical protein FRC09_017830 [Ceratobasidium sp. 395]|nr:hypothetical protein FRC09_017830 [Ceratobasidium sp. 395]
MLFEDGSEEAYEVSSDQESYEISSDSLVYETLGGAYEESSEEAHGVLSSEAAYETSSEGEYEVSGEGAYAAYETYIEAYKAYAEAYKARAAYEAYIEEHQTYIEEYQTYIEEYQAYRAHRAYRAYRAAKATYEAYEAYEAYETSSEEACEVSDEEACEGSGGAYETQSSEEAYEASSEEAYETSSQEEYEVSGEGAYEAYGAYEASSEEVWEVSSEEACEVSGGAYEVQSSEEAYETSSEEAYETPSGRAYQASSEGTKNTDVLSPDTLMALNLQEEYDAEDRLFAHLAPESQLGRSFDCGICFETFHSDALAPMDGCDHPYCRECMLGYVQAKLDSRSFPMPCPTCQSARGGETQGTVGDALIQTIGITYEQYEIYNQLLLAQYAVTLHCRGCERTAYVDRADLNMAEDIITCPLPDCSHSWCKNCNMSVEGGGGHSCDGTTEMQSLVDAEGWKEEIFGSLKDTTSHFCYRCGNIIIQSVNADKIDDAVKQHFRGQCAMFDSPVA